MKKIIFILVLSVLTHQSSYAGDNISHNNTLDFSSNVGFVTDYVFRGISQSDSNFAVQGGFDVEHNTGLYLGTWASNVDFNDADNASAEVDVYGGYGFEFKGLNVDLGAIYYAYPNARDSLNYNFYEVYAGVSVEQDKFDIGASINYTPENFGDTGDATYVALNTDYTIVDNLKLKTDIGYQVIDEDTEFGTDDYLHWGIGLGYHYKGFDALLKYSQSDLDTSGSCGSSCDPKVIFGVSRNF